MATWNGSSYQEQENPNFYNITNETEPQNWSDRFVTTQDTSTRFRQNPYFVNSSLVYQSDPSNSYYNQINGETSFTNLHQETNSFDQQYLESQSANDFSNHSQTFGQNNNIINSHNSLHHYRGNSCQSNLGRRNQRNFYQSSNLVRDSNLHASAEEFVPNYKKRYDSNTSYLRQASTHAEDQCLPNGSLNLSQENGRTRSDKRYDSKRDFGNKWRNYKNDKDEEKKYNKSFKNDSDELKKINACGEEKNQSYSKRERYNEGRERKVKYSEHNRYNRDSTARAKHYEKKESRNSLANASDKDECDWRQRNDNKSHFNIQKRFYGKKNEPDDDASQRERLSELLNRGRLECLVCCDNIRQNDYVWSCQNCYHVLHLKCIRKWANSSQEETGWRCPMCQNVTIGIPEDYTCFCSKLKVPEWNRRDIAHSCGEVCGRYRSKTCSHTCNLLCHPGSCPACDVMVTKSCGCGRTSQTQTCSLGPLLKCSELCNKILNCGIHKCSQICHHGSCEPCDKIVAQNCFCGKHTQEKICEKDLSDTYSCNSVCGKLLDCGNHTCKDICHRGQCNPCSLKPANVTHCCCEKTPVSVERKTCLDPVPVCDKVCSKLLKCGQPSNPHTCQVNCHEGKCPECPLVTKVKCRCGHMDKELPCSELKSKADDARCEKKCTKKRSCGKHKCNRMCCIDIEHICPLPCSKSLSCGKHRCEQTCHKGRCRSCQILSFEELYCECGAAVLYPPVPCGTKRPACDKPCSRDHPCDHEVYHSCHSDLNCPPCTVLTKKWCYGNHELRKAVPCYVNEISCGLPCNKLLSCTRHKCITTCHSGPCEKSGHICTQPCTVLRESCGHICAASCHEGKCPDTPCKEIIKVTCQCGHRTTKRMCAENTREYQRIASGMLASKMSEMQLGHTVDLDEVFGQGPKKQNQLKILECNEECKILERNRRLTLGLQIVNPDLSGKLTPRYSDFMKQWGKKDPIFCQMVHDKLTELVHLAKNSKQKYRSYPFECMNRDKRQFVHEYCDHFGCESQAYDQEPKRNVVATAVKDKCWLPSYSLLDMLQREYGQRKVPGPVLNKAKLTSCDRTMDVLPTSSKKNQKLSHSSVSPTRSNDVEPEIDYFNYNG